MRRGRWGRLWQVHRLAPSDPILLRLLVPLLLTALARQELQRLLRRLLAELVL